MNFGQGNIGFVTKAVPAGPPFPATSADNGLSVDAVTGRIVLGNDYFSGVTTGQLLNNREIYMNNNVFRFYDDFAGNLNHIQFDTNARHIVIEDSLTGITAEMIGGPTGAGFQANGNSSVFPGAEGKLTLVDFANPSDFWHVRNLASEFFITNAALFNFFNITGTNAHVGDLDGLNNGLRLDLDDSADLAAIRDNLGELLTLDRSTGLYSIGDVLAGVNGNIFTVDDTTGVFAFTNTALTAALSINGNAGFTGTVTPVNSITVEGGIVTAVS